MTIRVSGLKLDPYDNATRVAMGKPRILGNILIVNPTNDKCIAETCLEVEGIECTVRNIEPSSNYGQQPETYAGILATYWQCGNTFVNIEHDIAPWPGAIESLFDCRFPYCYYKYPSWPRGTMQSGIGCMKFNYRLLSAISSSWENWGNVPWWDLDGALIGDLKSEGYEGHQHFPGVAHVRKVMRLT
jgi:hypothetical protein